MGRPIGLPWSNRRISRTLSISLLVLCAALLAGPGAAATATHGLPPVAPVAAGIIGTHTVAAPSGPAGLPHVQGPADAAALSAKIHSDPHPSWLPARPSEAVAHSTSDIRTQLDLASRSLATGAGPAHGVDLSCTSTGSSAARCEAAHPAVAPEVWQNTDDVNGYFGHPTAGDEGSMAYDAYDGYVVFFGGCDLYACPDNQTWAFEYGYWFYISGSNLPAPPAETLGAMSYDQFYQVVLLYGGCSLAACPDNYTWYYTGYLGWINITNSLAIPTPALYGAGMTFAGDAADNYTILYGGCEPFCAPISNVTYAFVGLEWFPISTIGAPPALADFGLVYDPVLGASVLFGGCDYYSCGYNQTWDYYNFTWSNLTAIFAAFGPTPPARGYLAMTWDQLDNEVVMYGGWNGYSAVGDTWTLSCPFFCQWTNVTVPGEIPALYAPSMAGVSNATVAGTMVFGGGSNSPSPWASNGTYLFEPQLSVAPVVPTSAPARSSVAVAANPSGGSGAYFANSYGAEWWYGSNYSYGVNSTLNFTWPGTYTVNLLAYDRFVVNVVDQFTFVATGPTGSVSGASATDVGASVALTAAAATGGNAPYNYTWSFGDGSQSYGLTASHAWATASTFAVVLEVRDSENLTYNVTHDVVVGVVPAVSVAPSRTTIDAGMSITFTPTVSGGTSPVTYAWGFADGTSSSTATSPTHTFAAAGSYKVVVNVTDSVLVVATGSTTVTVHAALGGSAAVSSASVTTGTTDNFTATATGGTAAFTYAWVFGDAKTGTGAAATHSYATAGTYTAKVWINDSVGGSYSTTVSVTVTAPSGGSGTSGSNGGGVSGTTLYALVAVIAIVVVVALAVLMMRRRKPTPTTGTPPSGAVGAPTSPPSGASNTWSETPPPPPGAGGSA